MNAAVVKYTVGLRLAKRGISSFLEAADRLGISRQYLCNILACRARPAEHQAAIAKLCGCDPSELFGEYTHPSLKRAAQRGKESA